MRNPITPKSKTAPTGTARILGQANAQVRKKYKRIGQRVKILFQSYPTSVVNPDDAGITNNASKTYKYLISPASLLGLSGELERIINQETDDGEILDPYTVSSFNLGTTQAILNITTQVPTYPVTPDTIQFDSAHQARINIVKSRVFEDMQNLNGEMKTNLNRILTQGMTEGRNPRDIARQIYQEVGIPEWNSGDNKASYARALRVSRTEINHAHRTATRAQDQDANALGIKTKLLWFSALSATTRKTHAVRHGHTYTRQEVEAFYSRDANEISCKCNQSSIVLDENNEPYDPAFVERIKATGKNFFDK